MRYDPRLLHIQGEKMTILLDKLVAAANGRFPWRVALLVNLKDDVMWDEDAPPDAGAEFDGHETAVSIMRALESDGHTVRLCAADHTLPDALLDMRPDICFNIAEGIRGLNKRMTKIIWQSLGLPTVPFKKINSVAEITNLDLNFPQFVKPIRERFGERY
jgi:hypothetical protein